MGEVEKFNVEKVARKFEVAQYGNDDVLMEEYLEAYEEINKFFNVLGSVFGFVGSDIRQKIDVLEGYRLDEATRDEFKTFKKMIEYEKKENLLCAKKYVSGSRTLLRLHRGLEFVYEFLLRLSELEENDKVCSTCQNAYNDTLAKHHPWVVRKGALIAMHALPTQGELLKRVCSNVQQSKEMLPEMLSYLRMVYDRTEQLYTIHELHQLP